MATRPWDGLFWVRNSDPCLLSVMNLINLCYSVVDGHAILTSIST